MGLWLSFVPSVIMVIDWFAMFADFNSMLLYETLVAEAVWLALLARCIIWGPIMTHRHKGARDQRCSATVYLERFHDLAQLRYIHLFIDLRIPALGPPLHDQ